MERTADYRAAGFFPDRDPGPDIKDPGGGGDCLFAISTYNTDYILTKEENWEKALKVLKDSGYGMKLSKRG